MFNSNISIDPDEINADQDIILDNLPPHVLATMEAQDRRFAALAEGGDGFEFIVDDFRRWLSGQMLRVGFLGGDTTLHREIAEATQQITDACNIMLDFGFDSNTETYRTWSTDDTTLAAEIRVSFDQEGFFSLIGNDSITPSIGSLFRPVGGRPFQRSLNLGGFDIKKPANWMGVVRHEFLHAIAFKHEHQIPSSVCESEFRFEDDPGYRPTSDALGRFTIDASGRRPGIYTYLSGFPNFWDRQKVDHNLRPVRADGQIIGDFDRASVMLYRFPAFFYRTSPSPCAPSGNGIDLSEGDIEGLLRIYPHNEAAASETNSRRSVAFEALLQTEAMDEELAANLRNQLETLKKD